MEPRAKTLVERLGFLDTDRRKFKHDEIQIWVYKNFRSILKQVLPLVQIDDAEPLDLRLEHPSRIRPIIETTSLALWTYSAGACRSG